MLSQRQKKEFVDAYTLYYQSKSSERLLDFLKVSENVKKYLPKSEEEKKVFAALALSDEEKEKIQRLSEARNDADLINVLSSLNMSQSVQDQVKMAFSQDRPLIELASLVRNVSLNTQRSSRPPPSAPPSPPVAPPSLPVETARAAQAPQSLLVAPSRARPSRPPPSPPVAPQSLLVAPSRPPPEPQSPSLPLEKNKPIPKWRVKTIHQHYNQYCDVCTSYEEDERLFKGLNQDLQTKLKTVFKHETPELFDSIRRGPKLTFEYSGLVSLFFTRDEVRQLEKVALNHKDDTYLYLLHLACFQFESMVDIVKELIQKKKLTFENFRTKVFTDLQMSPEKQEIIKELPEEQQIFALIPFICRENLAAYYKEVTEASV
jgi:predicted CopG family antitoxin